MRSLRVALIGAGSMAAHHARVISCCPAADLSIVVDRDGERAGLLARQWGTASTTSLAAALHCDAAVVATATVAHAAAALALIDAGVPVLVEKPLTRSLVDTRDLLDAARHRDVALMCGLVERFNSQVLQLTDRIGRAVSHVRTARIGPAPKRAHSSVVDDVLLHDLDLVLRLTPDDSVRSVHAEASAWSTEHGWPETVSCELTMDSGVTASLHASRLSPLRFREIVLTQPDGRQRQANLLTHDGDPLADQFQYFCWLVRYATASERELERAGILPSHELAHAIDQQLAQARCVL